MKSLLVTNQFGARVVTCAAHVDKVVPFIFGATVSELETAESCEDCRLEQWQAEIPARVRAALLDPNLSHTRFRHNRIHVYHFDYTSPSGFMLAAAADEATYNAVVAALRSEGVSLKSGAVAPLSPTEAR